MVPRSLPLAYAVLLITVAFSHQPLAHSDSATDSVTGNAGNVLAVWNTITIDQVGARSRRGAALLADCVRLGAAQSEVGCFSIQQNFWITNTKGEAKYWVQNVAQFAELEAGSFFGTYAFIVWNASDAFNPVYCDPSTRIEYDCRAPMYTTPVHFPRSFTFYANINNDLGNATLQVKSEFASKAWEIPVSAGCPCFINAILHTPPPWGHFPFELVMVGLDNGATAYFEQGTSGAMGKSFIKSQDEVWHQAVTHPFKCLLAIDCPTMTATGEGSKNLRWNNDTERFQWSEGAYDQGVYITSITSQASTEPSLPDPVKETYLYFRIGLSDMAFLTIVDDHGRMTGYNVSSGKIVVNIPRSLATLSGEQGVTILNPNGTFHIMLTPTGSGPCHLLVSRTTNVDSNKVSIQVDGTILAWEPISYSIDSETVVLHRDNSWPTLWIAGLGLVAVIGCVFGWRKLKPTRKSNSKTS